MFDCVYLSSVSSYCRSFDIFCNLIEEKRHLYMTENWFIKTKTWELTHFGGKWGKTIIQEDFREGFIYYPPKITTFFFYPNLYPEKCILAKKNFHFETPPLWDLKNYNLGGGEVVASCNLESMIINEPFPYWNVQLISSSLWCNVSSMSKEESSFVWEGAVHKWRHHFFCLLWYFQIWCVVINH